MISNYGYSSAAFGNSQAITDTNNGKFTGV